jgi:3-oxoacyl-[acyl-carrier protein] reductase
MEFGLQGKVAMVAAASKGIGLACAQELAKEGATVSICSRNEDALMAAAETIEGDAHTYVVDVANAQDLEWWAGQTREDCGGIDILVTNTGGPPAGKWPTMTDEQWIAGFESTLLNVVRLMREVSPDMQAKGWGRIVHLTSLVAKEPSPMLPISSTLRTGIMALTRLQATELAPHGITVNSVLPGHTDTDRQTVLAQATAEREGITIEEARARAQAKMPMGRMARPDEIAAAVAFLCSERASYITGVNLLVDGGFTQTFG